MAFDYTPLLRNSLPPGAPGRREGFPPYNFVGGHNDREMFPVDAFIEASRAVISREGQNLAMYGLGDGTLGYRPLREFVAQTLNQRTGMAGTANEVMIVSGSLQALDLVNAALVEAGDTVIVEEATYQGAIGRLQKIGAKIIGAPLDEGGIRMDALSAILSDLKAKGITPKYIYTVPTVQNPTGSVMTEARRLEFLQIARDYNTAIFEDDCYADLTFDGTRPKSIRALDDGGQVVYCGSFSKTIAPALRLGFLVADWNLMSRMLPLKTDAGTGALTQMILAEFCNNGFDDHVAALQATLRKKCETMLEALAAEFGTSAEVSMPKGGIVVWVTLPDEVDTMRLYEAAGAEGVAINPGAEWMADPKAGKHRLRLCYASATLDEIREGVAKLADICHRETGIPIRSGNVGR
jgi:2-aminoadipate transaminase